MTKTHKPGDDQNPRSFHLYRRRFYLVMGLRICFTTGLTGDLFALRSFGNAFPRSAVVLVVAAPSSNVNATLHARAICCLPCLACRKRASAEKVQLTTCHKATLEGIEVKRAHPSKRGMRMGRVASIVICRRAKHTPGRENDLVRSARPFILLRPSRASRDGCSTQRDVLLSAGP